MIVDLMDCDSNTNLNKPPIYKFRIDSPHFDVNFEIKNLINGNFPHIGISAREGLLILYKHPIEQVWLNVDALVKRSNPSINLSHMVDEGVTYEVMIYGPVLSELSNLTISSSSAKHITKIENKFEHKILFAGGIHSFGIGCTTVGTTFSSIIGRKMNVEINNIVFNKPNFLPNLYVELKELPNNYKVDICILEVDYINQNDEYVEEYLEKIMELLTNISSKVICWFTIPNTKSYKKNKLHDLFENNSFSKEVLLKDFSYLYDEEFIDRCTFSGKFINDYGNILIFKEFNHILGGII
ncbi:hypothetical protein [Methanosphaera sp. WGK6]|uniref:hypothetical protein n=1 Tax=Methanosphaera sp. WGK6 TaxID=1561964 RepID=UPI00084C57A3|nr:hypothetical protein [Methanosphaera sp. WGK6]OED29829.1 hypothetical protein NL43_05935 [Methanosphaera sp. WGK6]